MTILTTGSVARRNPTSSRARALALVLAVIAVAFALGATVHTGATIVGWQEPVIVGASVVEGVCALGFAAACCGLLSGARRRGRLVRLAHLVGIVGVLFGMLTLDLELGPRTLSNDVYHLAVLAAMLFTLRYYERRVEPPPRGGKGS